jgi:hypothetical protein
MKVKLGPFIERTDLEEFIRNLQDTSGGISQLRVEILPHLRKVSAKINSKITSPLVHVLWIELFNTTTPCEDVTAKRLKVIRNITVSI